MSKTLDQAYSRYEDYLSKRKQVDTDSEQYVREQRYLSEQVELLKLEENRCDSAVYLLLTTYYFLPSSTCDMDWSAYVSLPTTYYLLGGAWTT